MEIKQIFMIEGWGISSEIVLKWLSLDLTDKSILVQVIITNGLVLSGNTLLLKQILT